jgi:hypothetical protein
MIEKIDLLLDQTDTSWFVMRITSDSSSFLHREADREVSTERKEAAPAEGHGLWCKDYFYWPISEARESVCHAVIVAAGRTGHVTVSLFAVRVGHSVVTFDAGGKNPRRLPSLACRRSANGSKHECRSQRGADPANHINLLIVGWFCKVSSDEPKLRHERRHFQYRLVLGMILQADESADWKEYGPITLKGEGA